MKNGFPQKKSDNNRYGFSRPIKTRAALPIVIIVCDDTKTAVAYFTEVKREVKAKITITVVPAQCSGESAESVLSHAAYWKRVYAPHEPNDSVWALIDLEAEPDRRAKAHQAQRASKAKSVMIALSDPCFEVWTLAHLIDTGEAFANCAAVVTKLKAEWKKAFGDDFGKKGKADYSKLIQYRFQAVQRAKMRSASTDQSWTEIYKVIEVISSLSS